MFAVKGRIALIERALALDPNDLALLERQARFHANLVLNGVSSDLAADLAIADEAANHALLIQSNGALSLLAKAFVLRAQGRWLEAEGVLRRVIDLVPTEANRHWELGQTLMAQGRHHEALDSFAAAKRFAGGSDDVYIYDSGIAQAKLALGRLTEAIAMARQSLSEFPPGSVESAWLTLISAETLSSKDEAAQADLRRFLATPRRWHSMAKIEKFQPLAANPKLLDGLRQAGMPEQ
jgi:tetratricopeptide (TPR) repeat protein